MGQIISRRYRGNGEKDQLRVNISDYGAKDVTYTPISQPVQREEEGNHTQNKLLVSGPSPSIKAIIPDNLEPNPISPKEKRCMAITAVLTLLGFAFFLSIMIIYLVYPYDIRTYPNVQIDRTVQISDPLDPFWYQKAEVAYIGGDYTGSVTWIDCTDKHTMVDRYNYSFDNDILHAIRRLNDFAAVYDDTVLNVSMQIHGSLTSSEKSYFYIIDYDEYMSTNSPPRSFYRRIPIDTRNTAWTNFSQTYDNYGFHFYYFELPQGLNHTLHFSIDYVQLNSSYYNFTCSVSQEMTDCPPLKSKQESVPGREKQCLIATSQSDTTERFNQLKVNIVVDHLNWIFGTNLLMAFAFFFIFIAIPFYLPCHKHIKSHPKCIKWC